LHYVSHIALPKDKTRHYAVKLLMLDTNPDDSKETLFYSTIMT